MEKEISNIIEMLSSVISNGLAENGLCVILHCQYSFCYLIHCKSKFSISCEPASFAKVKGVLPLLSLFQGLHDTLKATVPVLCSYWQWLP